MILWRSIPRWLKAAWPVWALLPILAGHYLAVSYLADAVKVNKAASSLLQFTGALLVLISIDQNLGLFRGQSLARSVLAWFRAFPIKRPTVVHSATGALSGSSSMVASAAAVLKPSTLEGRIEALEHELKATRVQVRAEVNRLDARIANAQNDLIRSVDQVGSRVDELAQKLTETAVGGIKLQSFGVLLALYGAITGAFA